MTIVQPICIDCKHFRDDVTCAAFPKGIPDSIWTSEIGHNKPLPEQKNSIVFEAVKKPEPATD